MDAKRSEREKGALRATPPELGPNKGCVTADVSSPSHAKDNRQLSLLEVKDRQKKKKKSDKKKSTSGPKKRVHSSTPSNSDDADKLLSERGSSSGAVRQAKVKGRARPGTEKGSGKIREEEEPALSAPPDPPPEDAGCGGPPPESLRWEGALTDPAAEGERMELYRANRRRRYYLSGHLGQTTPTTAATAALGPDWGHFVQGGERRA